jgi:hypothetical protein
LNHSGRFEYALFEVGNDANVVNRQDAGGMTALHQAAAMGARAFVRALVTLGLCDYLIRDKKGRAAAELAFEWSARSRGRYTIGEEAGAIELSWPLKNSQKMQMGTIP